MLLEEIINQIDLLVFSDFNYGCLPQSLVDEITVLCKRNNVIMAADSQSSSQVGDVARYKNMDLITPTEHEARISTRNKEAGLVVLAEQLRKSASARNVLLKLGGDGLLIHASNGCNQWITDQVGALNRNAKDVSGAGDSLLITSAMSLACNGSIWEAAALGSIAAAIQVGRVGNVPLKNEDLLKHLLR